MKGIVWRIALYMTMAHRVNSTGNGYPAHAVRAVRVAARLRSGTCGTDRAAASIGPAIDRCRCVGDRRAFIRLAGGGRGMGRRHARESCAVRRGWSLRQASDELVMPNGSDAEFQHRENRSPFRALGRTAAGFRRVYPGRENVGTIAGRGREIRTIPFLLYSALGAALWTALYVGIGLVFRKQIDRAVAFIEQTGKIAAILAVAAVAAYFAVKWWRRRRSTKA